MKKLSKSQSGKIIERGKTLLIVFLCFCCVHNMFRIIKLYGGNHSETGEFWSNSNLTYGSLGGSISVGDSFRNMSAQCTMTVKCAKGRFIIEKNSEDYNGLEDMVQTAVKDIHLQKKTAFVAQSAEEWKAALNGDSLLVRFKFPHKTHFEARALSVNESGMTVVVKSYSELILTKNAAGGLKAFVKSGETDEFFSTVIYTNSASFDEYIKKLNNEKSGNCVFAEELNLDKANGGRVVLDSLFLMPIGEKTEGVIVSRIPAIYKDGINFKEPTEFSVNLMNAFGYNPNTVRQYSDGKGKLIFVGETGTVSISPDGQVEYKALGENEGIAVIKEENTVSEEYSIVAAISGLNSSVMKISGLGNEKNNAVLGFSEFPDVQGKSEVKVDLDYYVDNHRVRLGSTPAVEAVIRNGMLVEYRIKVKAIEKTADSASCGDVMTAIDEFCEKNHERKKITDAFLIYDVTADEKETSAVWEIKGE